MLEGLVERYGEGAIVTVGPYVGDDGETIRWILAIDGDDPRDADVRVERHPEHEHIMVVTLVYGVDAVEIGSWSTKQHPYGPAAFVRTLRDLRQ